MPLSWLLVLAGNPCVPWLVQSLTRCHMAVLFLCLTLCVFSYSCKGTGHWTKGPP